MYIDIRGVGRRALLKSTAKGFVKTRLRSGETVTLQGESQADSGKVGMITSGDEDGQGQEGLVVGMAEVGLNEKKRL